MKNSTKIHILLIVFIVLSIVVLIREEVKLNKQLNTFTSDKEVGTDAYYIDSIAFMHPGYSYEMCEDMLFLTDSAFNAKYR